MKSTRSHSGHLAFDLLDSSAAGCAVIGPDGEIVWINQSLELFLGIDRNEVMARDIWDILEKLITPRIENLDKLKSVMLAAFDEGKPIEAYECHVLGGDGRNERWLEYWSQPITFGDYAGGRMEQFYDITSRVQLEMRLEKSRKLLSEAERIADVGSFEYEVASDTFTVSEGWLRIHGITRSRLSREELRPLAHPDDIDELREAFFDTLKGERTFELRHRIMHQQTGEVRFVQTRAEALRDEQGQPVLMYGTTRDITGQLQAEEELRESRRTLSTLMSNLPGMAYRCKNDPDWTMEFVSAGCLSLTGYEDRSLLHNTDRSYNDLIHPEDQQMVWDEVQKAVGHGKPFKLTYRLVGRDEQVKWVWEQGRAVFGDNGEVVALEGFIADVTERKRAEEALLESEAKFRRLAETTNAVIFIYQDGRLVYANPAAIRVTGYTPRDMARMDFWQVIHPDQREDVKRRGNARLSGQTVPPRYEVKILTKGGETVWLDYAATVLEYHGERAVLGTAFDITERKRAENQLRTTTRQLQQERQELTEKNVALKQILEHLEQERRDFKQEISQEIDRAITPHLQRLKSALGPDHRDLKGLEDTLYAIVRKDIDVFKERYGRLTPRELEICDHIRNGLSSKQISEKLSLSVATVQKHREQIRKKLAITNKDVNLGSYLRSH